MTEEKFILLITKDINFQNEFVSLAAENGFRVKPVKSPCLAIEMLRDKSYYMVVADEDSDEMSPFALLHRMNVMQYDAPVIITAKKPGADDILLAYELGAFDILDKSCGAEEIISVIEKALTPPE